MGNDARSVLNNFADVLVGRKVSYASLLLNSLRICVDRQLNDRSGFFLWFEPVWHLCGPEGVLVGSRQAQTEERGAHAELNQLVERLVGRQIEGVSLDEFTNDIRVRFSGGYSVKTFVSDPLADEDWYIRDCKSNVVVTASAKGLRLETREERA